MYVGTKKKFSTKILRTKFGYENKFGYEKIFRNQKIGTEQFLGTNKKLGMKKKLGTKKKMGTKNFRYEKKLGERESSTCGELDPHSHIFGPFRQTSDKFLEGNIMNTHFGSGTAGPTRVKM